MNTRYTLFIIAQLAYISSCAIIIQNPPPQANNTQPSITNTVLVNSPYTQTYEDPKNYINIPQPTALNKQYSQNTDTHKTTTKLTLCSVFIPPTIPEVPRVDIVRLNAIPANDHEAVKSLLIDNIQAINEHSKKVEESLKSALLTHRRSCILREVVDKK